MNQIKENTEPYDQRLDSIIKLIDDKIKKRFGRNKDLWITIQGILVFEKITYGAIINIYKNQIGIKNQIITLYNDLIVANKSLIDITKASTSLFEMEKTKREELEVIRTKLEETQSYLKEQKPYIDTFREAIANRMKMLDSLR